MILVSYRQRPPSCDPSQSNGASNTFRRIKYLNFYNLIADKPSGGLNREPPPAFSHPGMLSAALQGNLPPASHQPPTPPRTPQGNKYDEAGRQSGPTPASLVPKMPSLFAMGLQQQMAMAGKPAVPGAGGMPPLTSHVKTQGLQGKQILHLPTLICPNLQKKDF